MLISIKNKSEKVRFGLVGGFNTALDFGVLFGLQAIGMPVVVANIISTTVSFIGSFLMNKKYTFKTNGTNFIREAILFTFVTLFGLWVLQNGVIVILLPQLQVIGLNDTISLFVAKVLATCVSLVWNYILYSRFVFNENPLSKD